MCFTRCLVSSFNPTRAFSIASNCGLSTLEAGDDIVSRSLSEIPGV